MKCPSTAVTYVNESLHLMTSQYGQTAATIVLSAVIPTMRCRG